MRFRDTLIQLIGARNPNCPNDADVLAYTEGKLTQGSRSNFERHFTHCDDCRQVLAFLGREAVESPAQVAEDAVSAQTSKVLAYINDDERNRNRAAKKAHAAAGFSVSYPRLASVGLTVVAIAIAVTFFFRPQSSSDAAMEALNLGLKDGRYTEARVSGGFSHSRYLGTRRGADSESGTLHFDRAEDKVKAAREESASVDDRLMLARICLGRGTREEAKRALEILNQLAKRGVETAQMLNDTGVAHFQLDNYDDAIVYFTKALAKAPNNDEALFNLALAEGFAHHNEDARRDWEKFIAQSSDDKWKSEARGFLDALGAGNR